MRYEEVSAADVYEAAMVTGIFSEWTPALVATAKASSGERVLDLACGTGAVAREVARALGPDGAVVAVDISRRCSMSLEPCRRRRGAHPSSGLRPVPATCP